MSGIEISFWLCSACVVYTFVGYPLLLGVWAKLRRRPIRVWAALPRSVSFVVCAHNEEEGIERRLQELLDLLATSDVHGEVILVSDGSTDATAAVARSFAARGVRVLETSGKVGKAAALTTGCRLATSEIIVFADVRQSWAPDALQLLLKNFADPEVGAVAGDLVLEESPGVLAGVGAYWHFEKWLRRQESRVWSMVGATGAISAVRRELFAAIPPGTVLDDVYWPLCVAMNGRRVVMEPRAHAFDRLPSSAAAEFRRKVRTLGGNYQLMTLLPSALLPWRNPIWLQLVSHKLLRLLVPWLLLALLPLSLLAEGPTYRVLFWCQAAGYGLGVLGLWDGAAARSRLIAAAGSFLVLNGASWAAFWVWASGRTGQSWRRVEYDVSSLPASRGMPVVQAPLPQSSSPQRKAGDSRPVPIPAQGSGRGS